MTLYVITGPPCSGKTSYAQEHAQPGDVIIDYDLLARALGSTGHDHPAAIRSVALEARQAAIARALRWAAKVNVYVIHTEPDSGLIRAYTRAKAQIVPLDPGKDIVLARCEAERPLWAVDVARAWYARRERGRA